MKGGKFPKHSILITGWKQVKEPKPGSNKEYTCFYATNTWGTGWGVGGKAWICLNEPDEIGFNNEVHLDKSTKKLIN
jgi:C1A family cysteine protease